MICIERVHSRVVKSIDYKDYRQYHSVVIRPEVHHIAKARASEMPAARATSYPRLLTIAQLNQQFSKASI